MTLYHYFLSPEGRISRLEYWLGMIALMAISLWGAQMFDPLGFTPLPGDAPKTVSHSLVLRPPSLGVTLWNLIFAWPTTVVAVKRFNDRDWPQWVGYALGAAMVVLVIANYHGLMLDMERMSAAEKVFLACAAVGITWSLIDNGFLRGAPGPNRHGPDPLAGRGVS